MRKFSSRSTTQITNVRISNQTKYETRGLKITDIHGEKHLILGHLNISYNQQFYTFTQRANMWLPSINQ